MVPKGDTLFSYETPDSAQPKYMIFRGEVTNASLAFAGYTKVTHDFVMK